MEFNGILFPSPKFKMSEANNFQDELIYIPRIKYINDKPEYIPCIFLQDKSNKKSKNFLLLFHGNAEDIFGARILGDKLRQKLYMNIIIIEYPGYSIYKSNSKNSDIVLENTLLIYDFIKGKFNINNHNIFILGRSIGTSPAIYLASKRKPNALFVISGFSSIKAVAHNLVGPLNVLIKERFLSIDYIKNVTCPIMFIHGQNDPLIPFQETLKLKSMCNCPFEVILPEDMTHNEFDLDNDIIIPIQIFISKNCILDEEKNNFDFGNQKFTNLFITPPYIEKLISEKH